MILDRIDIVLVRPSRPPNVAAACRAMKNMGLSRLRLVDPPPGLDRPESRAQAYGAWDVLDGAVQHQSLGEAVAGSTLVVGTSAREDATTRSARDLAEQMVARAAGGRVAIVFGPEASGLTNAELAFCHLRLRIPTSATHPSLNLAQAVLIVAYELRLAAENLSLAERASREASVPVTTADLEAAISALREGLLAIGYLNPQNPDAIVAELRALVARAEPTEREVTLLRGIARQIRWAGEKAYPKGGP